MCSIKIKTASDVHKEQATLLLDHESGKTTKHYYERLPTKVKTSK
jgi:hypothetical protein